MNILEDFSEFALGGRRKGPSVFKLDPANQLGLDFQKSRAKLMSLALTKPERYYALRAEVIEKLTEKQVTDIYEQYWNVLSEGKWGDSPTQIFYYDEGRTAKFIPGMPESKIGEFALRCANAIREIAEDSVEELLPANHLDLAQRKSKELLASKAI